MLDILAISYHNIGPLYEQALSVFFHQGKFLINAPIGTGKSFLFFDGPLYGLYKYSERKLLNNRSVTGYLKILFKLADQWYLIIRKLTPGKTKDGCSSSLYLVKGLDTTVLQKYTTIAKDVDIEEVLKQEEKIKIEQIPFKNEVDLNMGVVSMLPPREVFTNTMLLLQDSGNIFELTPANRLLVLKNVFGLLGIDEIKDKMAQIKRNIQTQKKVYSSTEEIDKKLKQLLGQLLEQSLMSKKYLSGETYAQYADSIQELKILNDVVNIEKFKLDDAFFGLYGSVDASLQEYFTKYTTLKTQKDTTDSEILNIEQQIKDQQHQIKHLEEKKNILQQQLTNLDAKKGEILKVQKNDLQKQIDEFSDFGDKEKILKFVENNPDLFKEFTLRGEFSDFKNIVQILIDQGKILKLEQENIQTRIKNKQEELVSLEKSLGEFDIEQQGSKYQILYQQKIENLLYQTEITQKEEEKSLDYLSKEYLRVQESTKTIKEKIIQYQETLTKKLPFYQQYLSVEDFDEEIKKSTYVDMQNELKILQDQQEQMNKDLGLEVMERQIKEKQEKIVGLQKKYTALKTNPKVFLQSFFDEIDQEKKVLQGQVLKLQEQNNDQNNSQNDAKQVIKLEEALAEIRQFLPTIARKQILEDYEKYAVVQQQLKILDGKLAQYEQQSQKIQEYQLELRACDTQIQSLHQQNLQIKDKYDKVTIQQKEYATRLSLLDYNTIQQGQNLVRSMDNTLHSIKNLIDDFSEILIKVKKLTHDEGLSKNLYNALSKDLILFVLEDNLPVLSEIINNFLSAIVDFQIDMKLSQRGNTLELDTTISDQKGIRETKSLSGGQKVILKLVWMLAVSVYSQSKMLFLDETINNLDPDTVAKVAELLQNFAQQNTIKMYVVSHSSEIKSMNIWDGMLDLGNTLVS